MSAFRVDIWDVEPSKPPEDIDCGYARNLEDLFQWGRTLGKGGFGTVKVVSERTTGIEFACKSVAKRLNIPNISPEKQAQHIDNIKREIRILTKLRGTLSVVHFKGAYEDPLFIHMVMELCTGGELHHTIGRRAYTEATIAGYMRSVLATIAQCHSHRILHRDIKPGNFMLLTEADDSPLKAIDFGLAVFYDENTLPRSDLGLEGTPWFMAPEALSSEVWPASDVWAAGVMAYQLLCGYLPFDDHRNPEAPALSIIWKGILTEEPSFRRSAWKEVSDEAMDFVKKLLIKDPKDRPTAREAMRHPWIIPAFHAGKKSKPLNATVVQRIQRYAQSNAVKRSILELIANELLKMVPLSPHVPPPSGQQQQDLSTAAGVAGVGGGGGVLVMPPGRVSLDGTSSAGSLDQESSDNAAAAAAAAAGGGGGGSGSTLDDDTSVKGGILFFPMSPPGGTGEVGGRSPSFLSPEGSVHGGARNILARSLSQRALAGATGGGGSAHGGRAFYGRSPSTAQFAALLAAAAQRRSTKQPGGPDSSSLPNDHRNHLQRMAATVHGPGDYWRILRAGAELAAMESNKSTHGGGRVGVGGGGRYSSSHDYIHLAARTNEEKQEQRKAARLALDTSVHGGGKFYETLVQRLDSELRHKPPGGDHSTHTSRSGMDTDMQLTGSGNVQYGGLSKAIRGSQSMGNLHTPFPHHVGSAPVSVKGTAMENVLNGTGGVDEIQKAQGGRMPQPPSTSTSSPTMQPPAERVIGFPERGLGLERVSAPVSMDIDVSLTGGKGGRGEKKEEERGRGRSAALSALQRASAECEVLHPPGSILGSGGGDRAKKVSFAEDSSSNNMAGHGYGHDKVVHIDDRTATARKLDNDDDDEEDVAEMRRQMTSIYPSSSTEGIHTENGTIAALPTTSSNTGGDITNPKDLEKLMKKLSFDHHGLNAEALSAGLQKLGYDLHPSEVAALLSELDVNADGTLGASEFIASQLDWRALAASNRDLWLECARRAFSDLDAESKGKLSSDDLVKNLRKKLPSAEVDWAVEDALMEAGYADAGEVDFEGFLKILRVGSMESLDSLEQYDARLLSGVPLEAYMDMSIHGGSVHGAGLMKLQSVPEDEKETSLMMTGDAGIKEEGEEK